MHLTGNDAHKPSGVASERLQAFLKAKLNDSPYRELFEADFAKFKGVEVAIPNTPDKKLDEFYSTKPFLMIEIVGINSQSWRFEEGGVKYLDTRHEIDFMIEVVVSDACRPVEQALKDALLDVIDEGTFELTDLALEEAEIVPGQGRYPGTNRINPHTLSCAVSTRKVVTA